MARTAAGPEIEAKWLPRDLRAARTALEALGVPRDAAGAVERVDDLYLDAADGRLREAGWAFRLRRREDGRVEATLKSIGRAGTNGIHEREERTVAIPYVVSDPKQLPDGEPKATLVAALDGRALVPLARVRGTRTTWRLRPNASIEADASLDRVRLASTGTPAHARTEIEVERVGGRPASFRAWIARVEPALRLRRSPTSKLEAALRAGRIRLKSAAEMRATRASIAPKPKASTSAAEAASRALAGLAGDLAKALKEARHGAVEGAHDVRTGSRRTRSVLSAFRGEVPGAVRRDLRRRLRGLRQAAGPVRDLDVAMDLLAEVGTLGTPAQARELKRRLRALRRSAARAMTKALEDRALATLPDAVAAAADATQGRDSPPFAVAGASRLPAALEETLALIASLRTTPEDAPATTLHALRIAVKKARYAAEAFQGAFGKPVARFARDARDAQDALGTVQDARATRDLLRRSVAEGGGAPARAAAAVATRSLGAYERRARSRVGRRLERAFGERALRTLFEHLARRVADAAPAKS